MNFAELDFPLRNEDIVDLAKYAYAHPPQVAKEKLRLGWVCVPPSVGSGGHTTLFRMVQAAQDAGHDCSVVLYDRDDDDVTRHHEVLRRGWPWLTAKIVSSSVIDGHFDAFIASSWPTAHVIASRAPSSVRRFYFVQDFEPYFYPRGYLYQLAEDSYRLGFHVLALGDMVASELKSNCDLTPNAVLPFGCDRSLYRILPAPKQGRPRSGVVYYARQDSDRRGYLLAKAALEKFHVLCPDQEIHLYGDRVQGWSIPVTNHGNLPPESLNDLYNRTIGSIAMSFTNISLVASELLAAGNIPVLNESRTARQDASFAVWAPATPSGLAEALAKVVRYHDIEGRALEAALQIPPSWGVTEQQIVVEISDACRRLNKEEGTRVGEMT
ncbi:glycosyltransferase family 1 protein [Paeniglutamicibacter sp. ABSL32-1]|uniref:glycosyltransferase family 1 protein n=1 Tax=Paeniglutamicibacter quisquiliarum TaxID=2849498 RepID=UPI001C2D18E6|nr:glycosyltransferase family 1 protein [Paeniglutamicibacter quisquiliarum]MBV1779206.1 glycosyltransferase family 1 protein [Paeniglutamicibacter quisquiliarum]